MFGSTEIAKLLIEKGSDVNAADHKGGTPLTAAVFGGNIETIKLLLSKGANVNDTGGRLAMSFAKFMKNDEIIKLLKDAGAKESNEE